MTQNPNYTVRIKKSAECDMSALPKGIFRTVSKKDSRFGIELTSATIKETQRETGIPHPCGRLSCSIHHRRFRMND